MQVYYSVKVSMFDWVPQFVVNFMSSKALMDATGWVKTFSKAKWKEMEPTTKSAAAPQETKKSGGFRNELNQKTRSKSGRRMRLRCANLH